MKTSIAAVAATMLMVSLAACNGASDGNDRAADTRATTSATPTPTVTPTPTFTPEYDDVATDVNHYLQSLNATGTFSDTTQKVDDAIGAVCDAADGAKPDAEFRRGFVESLKPTFGNKAADVFDATVESCRSNGHAAVIPVFNAKDYEHRDLLVAMHRAGFDEFILGVEDPDSQLMETCDAISGKKPGGGTERDERGGWQSLLGGSWSWSEKKADRFVDTLVAACRSNGYSDPYVPPMTASQEQAVGTAADYLDYSGFSRTGLIQQLEFEGFSHADASFAVDHVDADWNAEAVESAKGYLDYSHFSHSGLVQQLEFEGFTREQAEYGTRKAGL